VSIHFISGKPGGGKSLYATKLVFEELCFGRRNIVTNLALRVGRLNEYYHENYGKPETLYRFKLPSILRPLAWLLPDWLAYRVLPIAPELVEQKILQPRMDDICARVHLITDDEMSTFFCHRPDGKVEHITNQEWRSGKRPDYSVVNDHGVFFCLDEVHIAFNSRAWADTGAEVLYYLSQHRKLGDDVICVTQSVANVDKQFRSVAQDFSYIRNLGKERAGFFRLPLRFVRKTYSQPPSGNVSEPMEMAVFSLDVHGLAQCYDTAKGVGIHGRSGADTKERKKGLHWLWFAIGVPLLIVLIFHYSPNLLARALSPRLPVQKRTFAGRDVALPVSRPNPAFEASQTNLSHTLSSASPESDFSPQQLENGKQKSPEIFCTGYSYVFGVGTAFLSDGTTYSSDDHEIDWIQKKRISILGKVYPIKKDLAKLIAVVPPERNSAYVSSQPNNYSQPIYNQNSDGAPEISSGGNPNVIIIPNHSITGSSPSSGTSGQSGFSSSPVPARHTSSNVFQNH